MAGIYGNDKEDKFFENKLLNLEREDEMENEEINYKELEITEELIEEINSMTGDLPAGFDKLQGMIKEFIIPILQEMNEQTITDANHLSRIMEDYEDRGDELDIIFDAADDIRFMAEKLMDRARR